MFILIVHAFAISNGLSIVLIINQNRLYYVGVFLANATVHTYIFLIYVYDCWL